MFEVRTFASPREISNALERLGPGETLRVIVENAQSAADVPRSVAAEGHRVLEVAADGGATWSILIRKVSAKAPAVCLVRP